MKLRENVFFLWLCVQDSTVYTVQRLPGPQSTSTVTTCARVAPPSGKELAASGPGIDLGMVRALRRQINLQYNSIWFSVAPNQMR